MFAGIRLRETTYVYDEDGRVAKTIDSPDFIAEDHALLLGLEQYEKSLCRCGVARDVAWHADMDGWFETESVKCQACTVLQAAEGESGKPVLYRVLVDTRPPDDEPLSPFVMGLTTASS